MPEVEAQIAEACAALSGGDIKPLCSLFVAPARERTMPLVSRQAESYPYRWPNFDLAHPSLPRRSKRDPQFTALDNFVCTETFRQSGPIALDTMTNTTLPTLDPAQEIRIAAVHRGFLYQHLYAAACLLNAAPSAATVVVVERDEDIEIVTSTARLYVQVKTRVHPIMPSDIAQALDRFERLRAEHTEGRREGDPGFLIVANQPPGPALAERIATGALGDVQVMYPGQAATGIFSALPPAWHTIDEAVQWCTSRAGTLPFPTLAPDSLVWKIAGRVLAAAAGNAPHADHTFLIEQLPALFEQLVVQLQQFPAPPLPYRPQAQEPAIETGARVRIIAGFSGAGKTAWAAQAACHSTQSCAYYDCAETPSEALASSLVRELAARLSSASDPVRRDILLPGASGLESLTALDNYLQRQGMAPIVVLDNAHGIDAQSLRRVVENTSSLRFVLLCQPAGSLRELEATLGLTRESLLGWGLDEVASACTAAGSFGSAATLGRVQALTRGMPLFVESAARIAARERGGDLEQLCNSLEQQTNTAETAQEVILEKVFDALPSQSKDAVAVFSLCDVGLDPHEVTELLRGAIALNDPAIATILRVLRQVGVAEIYGNSRVKIHDAMRILGGRHFVTMDPTVATRAKSTLKAVLLKSLLETRDTSRFSLYARMLVESREIKVLVELIGEEMFHELGIAPHIWNSLEQVLQDPTVEPTDRFWALDGLIFSDMKHGRTDRLQDRFDEMERLLREHELGDDERLSFIMKRMNFQADQGDQHAVDKSIEAMRSMLPDKPKHHRVFRYNAACALFRLKKLDMGEREARQVVAENYEVLGITPEQVIGLKQHELSALVNRPDIDYHDLKHTADALELLAMVTKALGRTEMFARIHAMKFYGLVDAVDSLVRVGQDAADDFVYVHEFEGAREVLEQHVLPTVLRANMLGRVVSVRSQYAVVLAYCGDVDAAEREMARLESYAPGFTAQQAKEIADQKALIAQQRVRPLASRQQALALRRMFSAQAASQPRPSGPATSTKVGRNEHCPCGSGRKYKHCHG